MKKWIEEDGRLRILSIVIAIFIWILIVFVVDPAVEISVRDIPIQFEGMEVLNQKGLSVVNEEATTINLKVQGSRKRMGQNDMKTISAKADISKIDSEGVVEVPVSIVIPFENSGITEQNLYQVAVAVEKLAEKEINLEVKTTGSLATNYMAGPIKTNPEKITVRGPESAVGKIAGAGVVLNYANSDVDIDKELNIELYDETGNEFSTTDVLLKRVSMSNSTTMLHCSVLKLRSVNIKAIFDSEYSWDKNISIDDIEYDINPKSVQIYGDDVLTSKINEISTAPIPFERLLNNEKVKVKLNIPADIKILNDITDVEISLKKSTEDK